MMGSPTTTTPAVLSAPAAPGSPPVSAYLVELERNWPVGTRVRHVGSGWVGTVTRDTSEHAPPIVAGQAPAHGLLFAPPYCGRDVPAVVGIAWDHGEAAEVAWMRPGRLRRLGDSAAGDLAGDDAAGDLAGDDAAGDPPGRRRVRARRRGGGH
jgi:hypothetical protein